MGEPRVVHDELVTFTREGRRLAAVLPVVPEHAPSRIREGIARRRLVVTTGECPCGARFEPPNPAAPGVGVAAIEHERLCPADDDRLTTAIRRWAR